MTIKPVAERQRINPDTGHWEYTGVDEDGNTIAKDEKSARIVAQEYLEEYGAELKRLGLLTPATLEYIQERMDVLYPRGYTKVELAETVQRGIAIGDITQPAPAHEGPSEEEQRAAEFEAWSRDRNTSARMRQERRESDPLYRAWYTSTAYVERTGTNVTKEDVQAITVDHNIVAFADAFRRAPREQLRVKQGWVRVPGFLNEAPMSEEQFNQWIEAASAARLL